MISSALRATLRWLPLAIGAAIILLWLLSITFVWCEQASSSLADPTQLNIPTEPGWRDVLFVRIAITDTAVQEQRGVAQWKVGERIAQAPLSVIADGRNHTVVIPVGIHPDWAGDIENLQIVFPRQNELEIFLNQATVVKRSLFAFDALLGRILVPLSIVLPSFSSLVLLTAFLASVCLALAAFPLGAAMTRRVMIGSIATACIIASISVIVAQARLLPPLWQRFAGLDESMLARHVPHYAESAQVNQLLNEAANSLPEGEILVFDPSPMTSYFKVRAFYLLYPRRVSFAAPRPGRLPPSITGTIQPATGLPPEPGWQRAAGPLAGLEAWRAPTGQPPILAANAGFRQFPWGLAALDVVILAGYGVSSVLGWRGLRRWASALTFGAGLTAWWMTVLSLASMAQPGPAIPWSLISIGLPLAMLGGSLTALARRRQNHALATEPLTSPHGQTRFQPGTPLVMAVIGFLFVCSIVLAGLTPFGDQDSWTTWGFNSRALFSEGSVLRFLDRYAGQEMNHPSYPPGLPLFNAWHYLVLGGVSERLVKIIMPLWWLSLVGLIWNEARRLHSVWLAAGLTLLAATAPIFLDHATLGNADLPFTVALTVAAIALTRWIVAGAWRELVGALLALGVAAWLKLDGLYLGLALIGCAAAARWLHLRVVGGGSVRRLLGQTAVALIALTAIYAPWLWLTRSAGVVAETPATTMLHVTGLNNLGRGVRVLVSELLFSYNNSTWSLLGSGFLLLWPVCTAVVLAKGWGARHNGPFLFLVAATLTTLLFYTFIYVLRPFFSIERYVMHAAPLAVLAAIHALSPQGGEN